MDMSGCMLRWLSGQRNCSRWDNWLSSETEMRPLSAFPTHDLSAQDMEKMGAKADNKNFCKKMARERSLVRGMILLGGRLGLGCSRISGLLPSSQPGPQVVHNGRIMLSAAVIFAAGDRRSGKSCSGILLTMFPRICCAFLFTAALSAQTVTFQCGAKNEPFLKKANRLLLAQLALQPVEAGQIGLHLYEGKSLDDELDDYSPAALKEQRALLTAGRACFQQYRNLSPEDNADLLVLRDSIDSFLFQLDRVEAYKYQPQIYVEMIGSGLFFPLTQTTGTEQQRLASVVARMEKIPAALAQAKKNLVEADPVFIDTAVQENDGNKDVIQLIGSKIAKDSSLRPRFDVAAAQASLLSIRAEMLKVATPAHAKWFPDHGDHADLPAAERENKIISEVIGKINDDHSAPDHLLQQVTDEAHGARQFITQKDLLTMSSRDNMKIVPTPAFLRGIY